MAAQAIQAIADLLTTEGKACLPGLGTLTTTPRPAGLSLMDQKATAPSARIVWNSNLTADDGRLRSVLGPQATEVFTTQTRASLAAGQPVQLGEIGKLFPVDQEQIGFTPGAGKVNKSAYGLPDISLREIAREPSTPEPATAAAPATAAEKLPVPTAIETEGSSSRVAYWTAAVLILIFLLAYLFWPGGEPDLPSEERTSAEQVPEERLNVPPPPADSLAALPVDSASVPHTAIIAIGLYGRQRNVDKQIRRLTAAGYSPYTDRIGRNTRLGVEVEFAEAAELEEHLREIREIFTPEAFVMRRDGVELAPE